MPQLEASGSTTTTTRLITNIPDASHVTLASRVAAAALLVTGGSQTVTIAFRQSIGARDVLARAPIPSR